ncbi:MAG: hypothetical protein LBJ67_01550 [Planctomycetaceae bacterium]|jgi:hypothetical protein|nr:hypothetical protein [Planctomycetaceae bacterium]
MRNGRNVLFLIAFLIFGAGYGGYWAYQTQVREPRAQLAAEIAKVEKAKADFEQAIQYQNAQIQLLTQQNLRYRSLPKSPTDASNLYHRWLLEAAQYWGFENLSVDRRNMQTLRFGRVFPYQLRARVSMDQLSRFLYEFYWSPFLHQITLLKIEPIVKQEEENNDAEENNLNNANFVAVTMNIEGLSIPSLTDRNAPYPLMNTLPEGYWRRLSSGLPETYTEPIDSRNLLQFQRGVVDASDFTRLTAINSINGVPEIWLTNQLEDNRLIKIKLNQEIRIGSFFGKAIEIFGEDVVFETTGTNARPAVRWIVSLGESLQNAMAVPGEK